MKSRLYYAISCFLLAVVLLFLAVPLFTHRLYPKQQAIRVLHTMEKGEQLTDKDIEPITVGALQLSEGIALTEEDVIGRYAAVDLVAEDILLFIQAVTASVRRRSAEGYSAGGKYRTADDTKDD